MPARSPIRPAWSPIRINTVRGLPVFSGSSREAAAGAELSTGKPAPGEVDLAEEEEGSEEVLVVPGEDFGQVDRKSVV